MERIDHLMYKSGLLADGSWDQMDRYDKDAIEKLVELVIQDCINILEEGNSTQMTSQGGADMIKLHFGMVNE
jgi:hypothetical protein